MYSKESTVTEEVQGGTSHGMTEGGWRLFCRQVSKWLLHSFLLSIPCLTASPVYAIELPLCSKTLLTCCTPIVLNLGQIRATSGIWEFVALKIRMSGLSFLVLNAIIAERF